MIKISPSKLDMLAVCPCYEAGPVGAAAEGGSLQHEYAKGLLVGSKSCDPDKLETTDRENVEWYVDLVWAGSTANRDVEVKLALLDENFSTLMRGTADVVDGNEIWDYKSDRNPGEHERQMAAYALMLMDKIKVDKVTCRLCYGRARWVDKLTFTRQEADDLVQSTLARIYNPAKQPRPCEYCGWCENAVKCPALTKWSMVVAANYAPDESDKFVQWHPSEISDPKIIGNMLIVARIVKAWSESVEHHAKALAQFQGVEFPGWRLSERSGGRVITNLIQAFELSGLSQDKFLEACECKITKLEEIYAEEKGERSAEKEMIVEEESGSEKIKIIVPGTINKAKAKRELAKKLKTVIEEKPRYTILVKQKGT